MPPTATPGLRAARAALVLCAVAAPGILPAQLLGKIEFPSSGAAEAQDDFVAGVLYLHNFEYEDAREAFQRAREIDPGFAMAWWGEAMTHNHPIWMEQDTEAGRAVLAALGAGPEERRSRAGSEREAGYLAAVETLFGAAGDGTTKEERDDRYREAMRRLHEAWPEDDEAAAFYALSILGTAHEGRDFATYMRAAAVAAEVWERNDEHPGAAHYLIHSFDDPIHAPLGLPMARRYAAIAPAAAHAQHMTSHIFVALGLWQEVVDANTIASRVQNESLAARGRPPRLCGHYPFWLEYGYLQQGRWQEAGRVLAACRAGLSAASDAGERWHFAAMRARYLVDTEAWERAAELADTVFAGTVFANTVFADGLAAYHLGSREAVAAAIDGLRRIDAEDEKDAAAILALELEGLALLATDSAAALDTLTAAVAAEAALPYEFGPPVVAKPAAELLGEVLLDLGRSGEAGDAFRRQLERTPLRTASLLGLARAATASGEYELARETYGRLAAVWASAEDSVGALEEARTGRELR
ncbi:MAG: hypothetical protein OES32_03855 [Acidobacteriota bacterium]|nr:hypothetical protein [Acidobacteriota bacterium]MDH3522698.1 hypothetical protein [Acidobacteriota bacterium]